MKKPLILFSFLSLMLEPALATVTLPRIFSDNMVLQRDVPLSVWGWAEKGENITVSINNQILKARADQDGRWQVALKPMTHGGPVEMQVKGKSNVIVLKNILVGDVWLGSGQSNMEWIVKSTNDAENEIAKANYPGIRLFTVRKATSFIPSKDLAGGEWLECNPGTVGEFSAVAYFFGRKLHEDFDVPIGLVNSSWGGTNIQAWMSWDLMQKRPEYKDVDLKKLEDAGKNMEAEIQRYERALKDEKGLTEKWFEGPATADWKPIGIPQNWEATAIGNADGVVWFRKEFDVPAEYANTAAVVSLGPIDDQDQTWLNGKPIGAMNAWNENRIYQVRQGIVKAGKNSLVVRVNDTGGGGGIYGKPQLLYFQAGDKRISLVGNWTYRASVVTTDFGIINNGPNAFPSQLYNAMIAPIIRFPIKGVIWYQGESNTWEAYRYRTFFADMIRDWRTKWNSEFTFLWAQLANFMAADSLPVQSEWAELREAQSMTLGLPKTGQAVIIDIGEENDIHPRNKQDVGYRLALAALKIAYNKDVVYSGPVYKSMEKTGERIALNFTNTGGGLMVRDKYGYVRGFSIAGADEKFYWAQAYIDGDKVIVSSPLVKNPVAVRYAWGNNPDGNLYNKEGLPASPFRTDTWNGISQR
jgi:sialate O-acetylesterase